LEKKNHIHVYILNLFLSKLNSQKHASRCYLCEKINGSIEEKNHIHKYILNFFLGNCLKKHVYEETYMRAKNRTILVLKKFYQ